MGSLKRKHGPFSPSPSRRRYKVTLLQLLMTVTSEAYQARGIECDSMNTTKLYTDMPEHTSRLSKASCFTAPQNQTCTSPRERTTATNHRCTKKTTPFPATTAPADAVPPHFHSPRRCGRRRTRAFAPLLVCGRRRRCGCSPQCSVCRIHGKGADLIRAYFQL